MPAEQVVTRYLASRKREGRTARWVLGQARQELYTYAVSRGRADLGRAIADWDIGTAASRAALEQVVDQIRLLPSQAPELGDPVERWLPQRVATLLRPHRIRTLADLTLRVPRRRGWADAFPGLGAAMAAQVEAFFAANPDLTARARALVDEAFGPSEIVPLERQRVRAELDGSQGRYRAPAQTCNLAAIDDKQAVEAWLQLHESSATQRSYRKEAERLILWSVVDRGKALSSLSAEDAVAYRAFLRHPTPRARWVGPARPRLSPEWRPFTGDLSANSVAYAISVLTALFRWLVDQNYVLSNPFARMKVRGAQVGRQLDAGRSFSQAEWELIRRVAEGLESSYGWSVPAAHRCRFLLDFAYSTGLRAGELVGVRLGAIRQDGDTWWLRVTGKGAKEGQVVIPPLGRAALERYLVHRAITCDPYRWPAEEPILAPLTGERLGISSARLWMVMRRFFELCASLVQETSPALAGKLRSASPHWMRHTHASHALGNGAELVVVRDNLRHASIATTSIYLHADELKRAQQLSGAFGVRD